MKALNSFVISLAGKASILSVFVLTFLGFLGTSQWQFIFLDQPRPHYCLIACIGFFLIALKRDSKGKKNWIILALISILINSYFVLPYVVPYSIFSPAKQGSLPVLSIAHLTLDNKSINPDKVEKYLDENAVDIVSMLEVPLTSLVDIAEHLDHYLLVSPNVSLNLNVAGSSAWFVSKEIQERGLKVKASNLVHIPQQSSIPMMELDVVFEPFQEEIRLLSFQARRPTSAIRVALFHREFAGLVKWYQNHQMDVAHSTIIVGDFNTAPWSTPLRKLLRSTHTKNAHSGYGLQPTWHSNYPPFLRIPIDHILCSQDIEVISSEVGGDIASDHLPVLAKLSKL